jgi:hypothetical protein
MDPALQAGLIGLVGALIGASASITVVYIQSKIKDRRDRLQQATDLALAEFKMRLETAKGKVLPPIVVFVQFYFDVLSTMEAGVLDDINLKRIIHRNSALGKSIRELEHELEKTAT